MRISLRTRHYTSMVRDSNTPKDGVPHLPSDMIEVSIKVVNPQPDDYKRQLIVIFDDTCKDLVGAMPFLPTEIITGDGISVQTVNEYTERGPRSQTGGAQQKWCVVYRPDSHMDLYKSLMSAKNTILPTHITWIVCICGSKVDGQTSAILFEDLYKRFPSNTRIVTASYGEDAPIHLLKSSHRYMHIPSGESPRKVFDAVASEMDHLVCIGASLSFSDGIDYPLSKIISTGAVCPDGRIGFLFSDKEYNFIYLPFGNTNSILGNTLSNEVVSMSFKKRDIYRGTAYSTGSAPMDGASTGYYTISSRISVAKDLSSISDETLGFYFRCLSDDMRKIILSDAMSHTQMINMTQQLSTWKMDVSTPYKEAILNLLTGWVEGSM
jgi:hypothetical protein